MKKNSHTCDCNIVVNQTQCPPAIRMFYLQVWMDPDDKKSFRFQYPVLALRSEYLQCFVKTVPAGHYHVGEPTAEILMDSGWGFAGNETRIHAVILDEDYGLIDSDDSLMNSLGHFSKLVELPWPYHPDKDEYHLNQIFKALEKEALDSLEKKATPEQAKNGFQNMRDAAQ